jgi:transcriptional regulator with XRE-family HTH domain
MKKKKRSRVTEMDKLVGNRIRMCRKMLDMSQTDLGEQLGLSFQQVQKYEKGINRVSAGRLQHIGHLLKVPVPFFFQDLLPDQPIATVAKKSTTPTLDINGFMATTDGLALAKAFMKISNMKLRRKIVGLVNDLEQRSG